MRNDPDDELGEQASRAPPRGTSYDSPVRRATVIVGVLVAIGAGLWFGWPWWGPGDADRGEHSTEEADSSEARASRELRASDLAGRQTTRRDPGSNATESIEDGSPTSSIGARRTTRIVVATERGEAVEGLTIRRVADPWSPASFGLGDPIELDARPSGGEVDFLDDGHVLYLALRAPGRATEVVVARSDRAMLVPLRASRVVEGVVLEAGTEKPVPDVLLLPDPSRSDASWLLPTKSGVDGRFRLEVPRRGVARVIADPGSGAAKFVDLPDPAAPAADLVIHVARRISLGGRVLVGGMPVEGAVLRSGRPGGPLHATRTDASGAYRVDRLPEGYLWVDVDVGASRGGLVHRVLTIRGDDRGHAEEDFLIEAPWTISGTVVSGEHGVVGIRVTAEANVPGVERGATEAVTAVDGSFTLRGCFALPPTVTVVATTPRGIDAQAMVKVERGVHAVRDVRIYLHLGRRLLTGSVRDRHGQPVAGARVDLSIRPTDRTASMVTGADGRYAIWVEIGDVRAHVEAVGFAHGDFEWPWIHPAELRDVVLDRGGRVTGRVVDEAGEPVASAFVSFASEEAQGGFVQTDAQGLFVTRSIAGAFLRLAVTKYDLGYAQKNVAGVPIDTIVPDIVLVKSGSPKPRDR